MTNEIKTEETEMFTDSVQEEPEETFEFIEAGEFWIDSAESDELPLVVPMEDIGRVEAGTIVQTLRQKVKASKTESEREQYEKLINSFEMAFQLIAPEHFSDELLESDYARGVKFTDVDQKTTDLKSHSKRAKLTSSTVTSFNPKQLMAAVSSTRFGAGIRMWSSGFMLVLSVDPTVHRDIYMSLSMARESYGKNMYRSVTTGFDVIAYEVVFDHLMKNVISTNIRGGSADINRLRKVIKISDLPTLCNMALDSMYPGGWPALQTCINTLRGTCDYFVPLDRNENGTFKSTSLLKFSETERVNRSKVTLDLLRNLNRSGSNGLTWEEVEAYQAKEVPVSMGKYDNGEGLLLEYFFQHPSVDQYFREGHEWLADLENSANQLATAISDDLSREERSSVLQKRYMEQVMGGYVPWVHSVVAYSADKPDEPLRTYIDRAEVRSMLVAMENKKMEEDFIKRYRKYRKDIPVAINAIVNFKCPKCGSLQHDEEDGIDDNKLIPINVLNYFFYMAEWKLTTIQGR